MKVLVTGATGFIGTALCKRLIEEGYEVFALSRYVSSGSRYASSQKDSHAIVCDVRNSAKIRELIDEVDPDAVIHLAALTAVSYSFGAIHEVSEVIYQGTINVAEACKDLEVPHLIHASTSEYYGEQEKFPIPEDAVPNPLSPYAVAKVAAEVYIRYLEEVSDLPYTILRPFNTYNRSHVNQSYFVVERTIVSALEKEEISLYSPDPVRDFLDRDSHVDAYIKCLKAGPQRQAVNISLGTGISIDDLAQAVATIVEQEKNLGLGKIGIQWANELDRPHDIEVLIGDNSKAKELLDWSPLHSFMKGLQIAVKDWKEVLEEKKV